MLQKPIKELVYQSVIDCNKALTKGTATRTHSEMVGIFYNSLRRNISSQHSSEFTFDKWVKPHHLMCEFSKDGTLIFFGLITSYPSEWGYSRYEYIVDVVNQIRDVGMSFSILDTSLTGFKLSEIIHSIKN